MRNWMIFTDLDNTLLDHHTYSFELALPALDKIRQLAIPLIINSSKTYAEIKDLRRQLLNNWAFSVENGAAVFLPQSNLSGYDNTMEQIILGVPRDTILKVLHHLRTQKNFCFKGFADYSVAELIQETGLSQAQAEQAKQRLASEPIKWLDSQENFLLFEQALKTQGLQLVQGGRFLHIMGHNDKGQAMAWIVNKFNSQQDLHTIALGDSQNDYNMLELADYSAVIRKLDGSHLQLNKSANQVIYTQHSAPLGWQEAIDKLFAQLNIGEGNE
ncbi:MAG: HAD-IIB family hydrolase [Methyloprofundus sp.]|nr:HAD-IIB family hydrolase [Methyloprofundus sp.]MDT8425265.1 HAD-IIB family hydrolase [Methyloprofundus sp.]